MGYTLKIGNATVVAEEPDDYDRELYAHFVVESVRHEDAPHDGSPTDYTNSRWPSYTAWSDFCRKSGLYEMFYDEGRGLIRNHPGCFLLSKDHLAEIEQAMAKEIASHELVSSRLEWLHYWTKWALENCKTPAIENS